MFKEKLLQIEAKALSIVYGKPFELVTHYYGEDIDDLGRGIQVEVDKSLYVAGRERGLSGRVEIKIEPVLLASKPTIR